MSKFHDLVALSSDPGLPLEAEVTAGPCSLSSKDQPCHNGTLYTATLELRESSCSGVDHSLAPGLFIYVFICS